MQETRQNLYMYRTQAYYVDMDSVVIGGQSLFSDPCNDSEGGGQSVHVSQGFGTCYVNACVFARSVCLWA